MHGSLKPFWRNVCNYTREVEGTRDPNTLLRTSTPHQILANETCDLSVTTRTVAAPTDAGTVITRVKQIILRLDPDDPTALPREGDFVTVDGESYRVETILEEDQDPASGYPMGAAFALSAPEIVQ